MGVNQGLGLVLRLDSLEIIGACLSSKEENWNLLMLQFRGAILFVAAFFSILLFDHDLQQQQHAHTDHILFVER